MILSLLVGCALRRQELASLDVDGIQMREGRWVVADLRGKGGRVRTVAIPLWVKQGINAWMIAAKIEDGRLLRPLSKSGKLIGDELGDWAIWSVVEQCAKEIGIEHFGAHDLRRTCAKLCRKNGGDLEQIKFLLKLRNRTAGACIQRMQKVLTEMNVQLANVITDISGLTGMAIIQAILHGERNLDGQPQWRHPLYPHLKAHGLQGQDRRSRQLQSPPQVQETARPGLLLSSARSPPVDVLLTLATA